MTSHVSGVLGSRAELQDYGFNIVGAQGDRFDITYRAVVDYSGFGQYGSYGSIPVEITFGLNGFEGQTNTIMGGLSMYRTRYTSGPDVGKTYLSFSFVSNFLVEPNRGFEFYHLVEFDGALAANPYSLPFNVPETASSGDMMAVFYERGWSETHYYGEAGGPIDSISFSLTPLPVPEPAGWAMLGAGLLLTGAVARRRRC
ncbi:PEP-CTERM sorting domain-containing protein [[Empedobacter] haloabium]|uniref:PEP-CTERM sorting domain-containing protein n=1 Tax=[Empedobacter] haloabium TaxID=592317 RepID=A0ABZ1UQB1_9BURK